MTGAAPRAFAFRLLSAASRFFERGAHAILYVAAGLLTRTDLLAAIARRWQTFGSRDAEIHAGLFDWERALFARFLEQGDRVLLVGCGAGRDLLGLARLGYRVEGLDVADASTAVAKRAVVRAGFDIPVHTGSIEDAPLPGIYDVVIFSWYCYGYIPGAAYRVRTLERVRRHLAPGGRIVISYVARENRAMRLAVRVARLAARLSRTDWRPESGDVLEPMPINSLHYDHHFAAGELEDEAAAAGLTIVFHERDIDGRVVLTA